MLYVGIDLHSKQITVCVRNQAGEITLRRQVSTQPKKVRAFFDELLAEGTGFMALMEVCGFNDWLITLLRELGCQEIVMIHPGRPSKKKTDRRDANKLGELLWLNRDRLATGKSPQGLRQVTLATPEELDGRQLTALRMTISRQRTRTLNKMQRILHRHNLMWDYPTKGFQTKRGRQWLKTAPLPPVDRMEMDMLLVQWTLWDEQLEQVDQQIAQQCDSLRADAVAATTQVLMTLPGVKHFSALALASRIGDVKRFPRPRSLANYFGLTPGCRNSGNANHRLGSITKEGSGVARFVLGQMVIHMLKCDRTVRTWYQRIKRRRGAKIARVAVMRRMTTITWHMLTHQEAYYPGGPSRLRRKKNLNSCSTKGGKMSVVA